MPPLAVSVVVSPGQSSVSPVMFMVGLGDTVTVTLAEPVQPVAVVPVTLYTPNVLTVTEGVAVPLFQVYVSAPDAVSVVLPPWQNEVLPFIVIVGVGSAVTAMLAVFVHPFAPVPVTV